MSKTTMMNSVSMLMTLVLQPVVLVLFFYCELHTFLPPDWGWAGYLAQSLQYVLLFAWLKPNLDEEEEKPMPVMLQR